MNATLIDTHPAREWRTKMVADALSPTLLRAWLLAACALAIVIAIWFGAPDAAIRADRELAFLMRGMAAIKFSLVLAAAGVLWWRFGHPIGRRMAAAYLLGALLTTAASGLIWQLSSIALAALAFHLGGLTLLIAAFVDRDAHHRIGPPQGTLAP